MAGRWVVTTRADGSVSKERFDDAGGAVDAIERAGHARQGRADADVVGGALMRRFEPQDQVVARLELAGPGRVRGGVDVRGDGSAVAYTGRVVRRQVERDGSESAYDALRRALGA